MKELKKLNKCLVLCGVVLCSQFIAAQNVEKLYVDMPDALNPTLSKQNRLELIEYYKSGHGDSISNRFGKSAHLLTLDSLNSFVQVKNTSSSSFAMKVLRLDDNKPVLGVIRTVCAPVCQSVIEFYDTAWKPIPLQFTMPGAIEWVNKTKVDSADLDMRWVESVLQNSFVSLSFDSVTGAIIAKNNSVDFMSDEDRKLIAPLLEDKPIRFEFRNNTWQRKP
jgi:hypothetical protein